VKERILVARDDGSVEATLRVYPVLFGNKAGENPSHCEESAQSCIHGRALSVPETSNKEIKSPLPRI
jgi:hypothetical protein